MQKDKREEKKREEKRREEKRREEKRIPDVCVRLEVFKAVTMKNSVFWDVTPCGSCKNRRFEGT
jgi:hypothetical protein